MNKIAIHQPNFIPWLGYFSKIKQADTFVFLDDVQLPKQGGYVNRVQISIQSKAHWLTLPLIRPSGVQNINEVKIQNQKAKDKLLKSIKSSYGKTPYFKEYEEFIFSLLLNEEENLSLYNKNIITKLLNFLEINTCIKSSSNMSTTSTSTIRLIEIIKQCEGNIYISGFGGDNYQEHELYINNNINLEKTSFKISEYKQTNSELFVPGLSIIDALFNIGKDEVQEII